MKSFRPSDHECRHARLGVDQEAKPEVMVQKSDAAADHDWCDLSGHVPHDQLRLLCPEKVTPTTWNGICDIGIARGFPHPSCRTIEGKPYCSIYEMDRFLGGRESTDAADREWDNPALRVVQSVASGNRPEGYCLEPESEFGLGDPEAIRAVFRQPTAE